MASLHGLLPDVLVLAVASNSLVAVKNEMFPSSFRVDSWKPEASTCASTTESEPMGPTPTL